jgi:hypothetical protein
MLALLSDNIAGWVAACVAYIEDRNNNVAARYSDTNPPQVDEAMLKKQKRVAAAVRSGNPSKGKKAALRDQIPICYTQEVTNKLRPKLNAGEPKAWPEVDADSNGAKEYLDLVDQLTLNDIAGALRHMKNGVSIGADNFTAAFVKTVTRADNPGASQVFVAFFKRVMRGKIPDEAKPLLMSGALVCLPKPNGDVRPIGHRLGPRTRALSTRPVRGGLPGRPQRPAGTVPAPHAG